MGCYARLTLGSLHLTTTKDQVDYGIMWLFRPSDRVIEPVDPEDLALLTKYASDEFVDQFGKDNPLLRVEFQCSAQEARDRLDFMGLTYATSKKVFEAGLNADIEGYEKYRERAPQLFDERLQALRSLTLEGWLEAFSRIRDSALTREMLDAIPPSDQGLSLLRYMLSLEPDCYGFPGRNPLAGVRLILDQVHPQEQISYDLTDLVAGECIDHEGLLSEAEYIHDEILAERRVTVLTEGKTDRTVLKRSLGLFFPHLTDYFDFLDFTGAKVSGGAGELANLVRAFTGARVRQRVLAIFDNDTAASAALSRLDVDALPDNIVVRQYPDTDIARCYPTTGPSGNTEMNVNGRAASIELYLGEDVLRDSDGVLRPVQWKGYDPKLAAYQGEVRDKKKILEAFVSKLDSCEKDPDQLDSYDWDEILGILDSMRSAFQSVDVKAILDDGGHE